MKARRIVTACAAGALTAVSMGTANPVLAESPPEPPPASPHSVSANIGVVSNYIWRGVTQTQDGPAVQGGLDYGHESGFYVGTWISNIDWNDEGAPQDVIIPVDPLTGRPGTDPQGNLIGTTSGSSNPDSPNYELDLYGGFGGSINDDFSYDLSTIYYAYPDGSDSDFWEVGASGTFKWLTLGLAYTIAGENDGGLFDDGDWYYYGKFEYSDLPYGLGMSLRGGYYDFRHDTETLADGMQSPSADYWNYGASISKDAGDFGTFSLNWDQNDGNPDSPGGYDNDPQFWVGWNKEF